MTKDPPSESEEPDDLEVAESADSEQTESNDPKETEPDHAPAGKRKFGWPAVRRSRDDRLVAGVAGGLGEFFGVDPVIVRIGFIVLTFFGGVGMALYLVSWLIVPPADSGSILADSLRSGVPRRIRNLTSVALIVAGLVLTAFLSRDVFGVFTRVSSTAPYLALALIVAGIGLVFWPRRSAPPLDTPAEPTAVPTTATVPSPPSAFGSEWPGATLRDEMHDGLPDEPEEPRMSRRERRAERRLHRRGQSTVTLLTLAALAVLTGGAILLDRLDVERVLLGEFFAIAVLVVASALLVSVFIGRNWVLMVLGVLLLVPLVVFSGSDVSWWSGYGDVESVPRNADSWEREVKHGIGNLVVDLRSLDRDSLESTGRINRDIALTAGQVTLKIPADLRVRTNARIGAGEIRSGEKVTFRNVSLPRINNGSFYCVNAEYTYGVDEEIPDFRRAEAFCGQVPDELQRVDVINYKKLKGIDLEVNHATHSDYDINVNVEVGVGRVRVVRYPTHLR